MQKAIVILLLAWLVSEALLWVHDRASALNGLAFNTYLLCIYFITRKFIPSAGESEAIRFTRSAIYGKITIVAVVNLIILCVWGPVVNLGLRVPVIWNVWQDIKEVALQEVVWVGYRSKPPQ